ncbi:MAG: sialidase family protein [Adhaeribacter sp.]
MKVLPLLMLSGLLACSQSRHPGAGQADTASQADTVSQPGPAPAMTLTQVQYEHVFGDDRPFAQCHASTMIGLDDGRYLLAWFAGSHEKNDDVGIWMAEGKPGAWSKPRLAVKVRQDPHWNPVLFRAPDGSVYLYFKVGKEIDYWETWVQRSTDQGRTWSQARELVPGDKGGRGPVRNQPLVLSDRTWLAPASVEHHKVWDVFVDRSTDGGKTWVSSGKLALDRQVVKGEGVIQPAFWESAPGQVHMLMRSSSGRICRSDSRDYGKTWSPIYQTSLPNNNSGIDVAPISGDTLAVIFNPVSENWGKRYPITVAVSADNGQTWPLQVDIEKGQDKAELSYPDLFYQDGHLVACYTWNRQRIAFWKGKLSGVLGSGEQ